MYIKLFANLDTVCNEMVKLLTDEKQIAEFNTLRIAFHTSLVEYEDEAAREFCERVVLFLTFFKELYPTTPAMVRIFELTGEHAARVVVECICEVIRFELEEMRNNFFCFDGLCSMAEAAEERMNFIGVSKDHGFNHLHRCVKELAKCIQRESQLTLQADSDSEVQADYTYRDLAVLKKYFERLRDLPEFAKIWLPHCDNLFS